MSRDTWYIFIPRLLLNGFILFQNYTDKIGQSNSRQFLLEVHFTLHLSTLDRILNVEELPFS